MISHPLAYRVVFNRVNAPFSTTTSQSSSSCNASSSSSNQRSNEHISLELISLSIPLSSPLLGRFFPFRPFELSIQPSFFFPRLPLFFSLQPSLFFHPCFLRFIWGYHKNLFLLS